jgi:hypothetical protein
MRGRCVFPAAVEPRAKNAMQPQNRITDGAPGICRNQVTPDLKPRRDASIYKLKPAWPGIAAPHCVRAVRATNAI